MVQNMTFGRGLCQELVSRTRLFLRMNNLSKLYTAPLILAILAFNPALFACDTDAECGAGGTCIKREKRARGVCYGGTNSSAPNSELSDPAAAPVISAPIDQSSPPSTSGDAPVFGEEGYVEPSAPPRLIDRLDVPERTIGACITSTDCAGGQECVYRDPMLGHGSCESPSTH